MIIRDNVHYINIPDTSEMTFHVHTALHAPSPFSLSLSLADTKECRMSHEQQRG